VDSEPERAAPSPWRWPIAFALLGLLLLGVAAYVFHRASKLPGELLEQGRSVASELRSVAAAFRTGTITTTFVSYATEVSGGQKLQFATLNETEVFERTDRAQILWGQLELPEVVVRAEAPVEYTYYLDLEERWEFLLEGQTVFLRAPPIRFNSPAIDVSRLRYEVRSGSVFRDEDLALENLRHGLGELARARASENVALVRELGRRKTEEFVRTWLLSRYEDGSAYQIDVVFSDETPVEGLQEPRDTPTLP
jgi:hypothetical protein